jgi:hypothetical protein
MSHLPNALTLQHLRFTADAIEPLELDEHAGSSLRGALFNALLRRFCMNPTAPTCADCPLNATCPVAELVAPLRDEHPRGRDIPRPFVIQPPTSTTHPTADLALAPQQRQRETGPGGEAHLSPEQSFTFGITLIGTAARLLPYVVMAAQQMGAAGMGRPLHANGGRRGRFTLQRIALADPFSNREQFLYRHGDQRVAAPTLAITPADVAARASSLPADTLTIEFLTPTRLIASGQLVRRPDLAVLVARLAERLDALSRQYASSALPDCDGGDGGGAANDAWNTPAAQYRARSLAAQAASAHLVADDTHWVDLASYSSRQRRATPIGGFIGTAVFCASNLSPDLRELLVWGELLHVGKNAVKGDGRYRLLTTAP